MIGRTEEASAPFSIKATEKPTLIYLVNVATVWRIISELYGNRFINILTFLNVIKL